MENWHDDIDQILKDEDARKLARFLITRTRRISLPNGDVKAALGVLLYDVAEELPMHRAMRLTFSLAKGFDSPVGHPATAESEAGAATAVPSFCYCISLNKMYVSWVLNTLEKSCAPVPACFSLKYAVCLLPQGIS